MRNQFLKHRRFWIATVIVVAVSLLTVNLVQALDHSPLYRVQVARLSVGEVDNRIEQMNRELVPPSGTPLSDIEAVYGTATIFDSSASSNKSNKAISADGQGRYWHLIPSTGLACTVVDDRASGVGFNYSFTLKGRKQLALGFVQNALMRQMREQQMNQDAAENREILACLMEIHRRYGSALAKASWNRH